MTKIYVIGYYTGKNSYGVIQDAGPDGYELIDLGVYKNLEEMDARIDKVSKAGANNG